MRFLLTIAFLSLGIPLARGGSIDLYGQEYVDTRSADGPVKRVALQVYENDRISISGGSPHVSYTLEKDQLAELKPILEKFLVWEAIAREKDVMPFEKEIGKLQGKTVTFRYAGKDRECTITTQDLVMIEKIRASLILQALPLLPKAEADLAAKVARAKKEDALFN